MTILNKEVLRSIFIILFVSFISGCYSILNSGRFNRVDYGMWKYNKNFFFDDTEITVSDWFAYYSWLINNEGIVSAQKVLPDSNAIEPDVWQAFKNPQREFSYSPARHAILPIGYFKINCNDSLNNKYGNSWGQCCAYLLLPITGITYEQAVDFCKWKTKWRGDSIMTYRLPTLQEWKNIALESLNVKEKKSAIKDSLSKKGCPNFNYKYKTNCDWFVKNNISTSRKLIVAAISSNNKGYDFFGNVSEMTLEKGFAKGGNYMMYAKQCHVDSVQKYTKPEKWLGFRCVGVFRNN